MEYKTVVIDQYKIFYREGGQENKETILFLHGFPSSSHMYQQMMCLLEKEFYVVAPDYPGFGQSEDLSATGYTYSFQNIAATIERFIDALQLSNINLYVQDYGGPVGYRIAAKRPALVKSLLIQNANAYLVGFGDITLPLQQYAQNPTKEAEAKAAFFFSREGIRRQYLEGAGDVAKINPDSYRLDDYFMQLPGRAKIQLDLIADYKTNIECYPAWQTYFAQFKPPALILWGRNDPFFLPAGAEAYSSHLPEAELHFFNGGHFMLEEYGSEAAETLKAFLTGISP